MHTKETTTFPFLLGVVFIVAIVVFLFLLDHASAAMGIHPVNSALALLSFLFF